MQTKKLRQALAQHGDTLPVYYTSLMHGAADYIDDLESQLSQQIHLNDLWEKNCDDWEAECKRLYLRLQAVHTLQDDPPRVKELKLTSEVTK